MTVFLEIEIRKEGRAAVKRRTHLTMATTIRQTLPVADRQVVHQLVPLVTITVEMAVTTTIQVPVTLQSINQYDIHSQLGDKNEKTTTEVIICWERNRMEAQVIACLFLRKS